MRRVDPDAGHAGQPRGIGDVAQRRQHLVGGLGRSTLAIPSAYGGAPGMMTAMRPMTDGSAFARATLAGDLVGLIAFLVVGLRSPRRGRRGPVPGAGGDLRGSLARDGVAARAPIARRPTFGCCSRCCSAIPLGVVVRATFVQAWTASEILTVRGGRGRVRRVVRRDRARRDVAVVRDGGHARDRHARRPAPRAASGCRRRWPHDPGEPAPPLEQHLVADVCIVGGGFAGLWTAMQLTEREPGLRIALIEQDIAGGGASGRNGGFLSASWFDVDALTRAVRRGGGPAVRAARRPTRSTRSGAFVADHGIDCWFHQDGTLGARTGDVAGRASATGSRCSSASGSPIVSRCFPPSRPAHCADSPRFVGGAFIPDGAVCQPARLARGLRRVAARARGPPVRANAHDRSRAVAAGRGAHRARRHQGRPGRADHRARGPPTWRRSDGASA